MKYVIAMIAAMFVNTASATISDSEMSLLENFGHWDVIFIHDKNYCALGTLQDDNSINFLVYDDGYYLTIVTEYINDGRTELQIYDDTYNILVNDIVDITYGDIYVPLSTDNIYAITMGGYFTYTSMYTGEVTLFTRGFADAFVYYLQNCQ